jgi:hypothetical protein
MHDATEDRVAGMPGGGEKTRSQFGLLRQRRFGAFFITQSLGAFNDDVFKNALAVAGYLAARRVPPAPATAPDLGINWNPLTETS